MDTLHKVNSPPHLMCSVLGLSYGNVVEIQRLNTLRVASLQEGYAASRSHIASNAIKTNCPMAECMRIAKNLRQSSVLARSTYIMSSAANSVACTWKPRGAIAEWKES